MKLQNLLKQNKETITDYMNRAASYLRSMEQGAVTKDGYNLAEDLTVYEQEKLKEYIYCMAFDEMKKTVGRHCLNVCDFGSDREDFISNFQIVIMKRLKDFNAKGSAKKEDKGYEFLTYLRHLSGEAMRETFAGMRGVSAALEERIQKVRTAVRNVMVERQIKQEEVTAEMIQDQLTFTNKIETIKALMEFSTTRNSYESMLDENDDIEGDLDVKTEVFDGLDKSTEEKLDFFFSKLSDFEKFFVLVRSDCVPVSARTQTQKQISMNELLVKIAKEDKKNAKNVLVGEVTVTRFNRASNTEPKIYSNVEYIKDRVMQYQMKKAEDLVLRLGEVLKRHELCGRGGVKYFLDQWNLLNEKYSK